MRQSQQRPACQQPDADQQRYKNQVSLPCDQFHSVVVLPLVRAIICPAEIDLSREPGYCSGKHCRSRGKADISLACRVRCQRTACIEIVSAALYSRRTICSRSPFGNLALTEISVWLGKYRGALRALVLTRWQGI
jgi:hypothetical protein